MAAQDERDERDEQGEQDGRSEPGQEGRQPESAAVGQEPGRTAPAQAAKLVFTDPLSRQTADDTDAGWGESQASRGLDWYLSQRPPHHG
ncbi:hypothetical protein OG455_16865 [Kitasatospora sp. NBC_01287]|uniref:hypothetical protein n=1 Tax=Kitasatospora sp. NBC_01287 TaxID=2903573 RepID=UPI002255DC8F|nr:hypothetical protein [Kitasatospora sp. NBC_01287]MCX4747170.1 hypothetical protein [Kitasatospora sp. NBC_01287]